MYALEAITFICICTVNTEFAIKEMIFYHYYNLVNYLCMNDKSPYDVYRVDIDVRQISIH